MKKAVWILMLMLLLTGCAEQKQQENKTESSEVITEQEVQQENQVSLPVNEETIQPQTLAYLQVQYQPNRDETEEEIVQRMWYLANLIYFADETDFSKQADSPDGVHDCQYFEFEDLTEHLYTKNGKQQLLSAMVGGVPYLYEESGEYYHLGPWRTEPAYHCWMSSFEVVESDETRMVVDIAYDEKDLQDNITNTDTVQMVLGKENGIWLVEDFQAPAAKFPQ